MRSTTLFSTGLAGLAAALALAGATGATNAADSLSALPEYTPGRKVSGVLRSSGNKHMARLLELWQAGFRKYQPEVCFEDKLTGTASAMGAIDETLADMALLGRPLVPHDKYGIWRRSHMLPIEIEVASGSYDAPQKSCALTVFVHEDNPLSELTLKQLDGIFGAQRTGGWQGMEWAPEAARSEKENVRSWGQLGLTGDWAGKPIHPYGPPGLYPGGMSFFQIRVMGGADTWAEDLREFADRRQMIEALSRDRHGIAYACMGYRAPQVKVLALADQPGGRYVMPARATVADRTYPLTRSVYIAFPPDRPNGDPADPKVEPKLKEFLRYILSRQGQQDVVREGDYLPLTKAVLQDQLRKLE